jgi:hypothetical protein
MDGEGQPEPRQWSAEVRQYDHGWYFVEDSDYCPACYALGEPVED